MKWMLVLALLVALPCLAENTLVKPLADNDPLRKTARGIARALGDNNISSDGHADLDAVQLAVAWPGDPKRATALLRQLAKDSLDESIPSSEGMQANPPLRFTLGAYGKSWFVKAAYAIAEGNAYTLSNPDNLRQPMGMLRAVLQKLPASPRCLVGLLSGKKIYFARAEKKLNVHSFIIIDPVTGKMVRLYTREGSM